MPPMDGFRLCREVRQSETFGQLPFIAYTAADLPPGDQHRALAAGATACLQQLVATRTLVDLLRRIGE